MSDSTTLTVLKMFAKGRGLDFVAQATKLSPAQVRAIAGAHDVISANGILAPRDAAAAAKRLEQELARAATTAAIPVREAAPAPAPPTESVAPRRNPSPGPAPASAIGDVLSKVAVAILRPDPDNPRGDIGDVTELAASLKSVGLLQPIVARRATSGQLFIVAGHRRLAAAKLAGWTHVQVIIRRDMRPDDVLAAMLVENSHRKDLDPIEEARGYARLRAQLGTGDEGVAKRVGRPRGHITGRLLLLALPVAEQEQLRRGDTTLMEATHRARLASGRMRSDAPRGMPHLSARHPLSARAKARCVQLKHSRGPGHGVGGIACGECWESVIRADERSTLHSRSGRTGECALCDTPLSAPTREDLPA